LEFFPDFPCLARSPLLLMRENRAHRDEIQGDEHMRIKADPSDGRKSVI